VFKVSKSGTEIELYSDTPGSGYGLTKTIPKVSGKRLAFVEE